MHIGTSCIQEVEITNCRNHIITGNSKIGIRFTVGENWRTHVKTEVSMQKLGKYVKTEERM